MALKSSKTHHSQSAQHRRNPRARSAYASQAHRARGGRLRCRYAAPEARTVSRGLRGRCGATRRRTHSVRNASTARRWPLVHLGLQHPSRPSQPRRVPRPVRPACWACPAMLDHIISQQCLQDESAIHGLSSKTRLQSYTREPEGRGVHCRLGGFDFGNSCLGSNTVAAHLNASQGDSAVRRAGARVFVISVRPGVAVRKVSSTLRSTRRRPALPSVEVVGALAPERIHIAPRGRRSSAGARRGRCGSRRPTWRGRRRRRSRCP